MFIRIIAMIVLAAAVLIGCAPTAAPQPAASPAQPTATAASNAAPSSAKDTVVVGIYGGNTEQTFIKSVADEFQKRYGLKIKTVPANNEQRLAQLKTQRENPQMDIAWFTDPILPDVVASGVIDKIDVSKLSNYKDTYQPLQPKDNMWVVHSVTPWGIVYNADKVNPAPTSWRDLLDPKWNGQVMSSDITYSSSYLTLLALARLDGGDEKNLEPGFKNMKTLRAASPTFWTTSDQLNTLLKQGEVVMSPDAKGFVDVLAVNQKLSQFKFAYPKEGAYAVSMVMTIVKNAPNPDGAYKLLDLALDPAAQAIFSAGTFYTPINRKAVLPAEIASLFPSPDQVEKLQTADWANLNTQKEAIVDRWQKEIR